MSDIAKVISIILVCVAFIGGCRLLQQGLSDIGRGITAQQLKTMITSMQIQQGIIPLVPHPAGEEL